MKKVLLTALFATLFVFSPHFVLAQETEPNAGNVANKDSEVDKGEPAQTNPQTGQTQPAPTTGQTETPTPTQAPNPTPLPSGTGTALPSSPESGAGWSSGINTINQKSGLPNTSSENVLKNILNWLTGILAVLFMVAMVASGVIMIVSVGNQHLFDNAKKWLLYSIIGLIIALLAFVILNTIGGWLGL